MTGDSLTASLRNERADEETKRQMLNILKRFQSFDVQEDGEGFDAEASTLGFLGELSPEDVDKMTTEELMSFIGPEALRRFEEDLKSNPKFIEEELKRWKPWWMPASAVQDASETTASKSTIKEKIPEPLEELPPLSRLIKGRPPEMLWNNLVELIYLYIHLYRMYAGDIFTCSVEFAKDYLSLSSVLSSQQFAHASVIHALRSAEASVAMESDIFLSTETKALLLDDVICMLNSPAYIMSALADLQRVLEWSLKTKVECFAAAKKTYFYNVWLNDEINHDKELVATVLTSMVALVTGYRDKLTASSNMNKDEVKDLKMPTPTASGNRQEYDE